MSKPVRQGRVWMPSLDDYDLVGSVDPDNYHQGSGRRVFPPNSRPAPENWPTLHCGGCWCGEPGNHDWPGRADGVPHPR